MNKATLQTYVRATVNHTPYSAETIANLIQKQLPKEEIKLHQVYCILLQLESAGIIRKKGTMNLNGPGCVYGPADILFYN